jgi:hypothetical protein
MVSFKSVDFSRIQGCTELIRSGGSCHRCSERSLRSPEPDKYSISDRCLWAASRSLEFHLDSAGLSVIRPSILELCSNSKGVSSMDLLSTTPDQSKNRDNPGRSDDAEGDRARVSNDGGPRLNESNRRRQGDSRRRTRNASTNGTSNPDEPAPPYSYLYARYGLTLSTTH